MNLVIDVGNTRVKLAIFKDGNSCFDTICLKNSLIKELNKINNQFTVKQAIISSVALISTVEMSEIGQLFPLLKLDFNTKLPFINNYETPKTLGVDRIALAAAAIQNYPNRNVLIIDSGTCITYDYVSEKGIYFGGAIAPGLEMRYKSLNAFTDKLPLLKLEMPKKLIGDSTEKSIHSGVVNGVLAEINSIIEQYEAQNEKLTVVLTGGDANFLSKRLKNGIFANPNFLLEGLNNILSYNFEND